MKYTVYWFANGKRVHRDFDHYHAAMVFADSHDCMVVVSRIADTPWHPGYEQAKASPYGIARAIKDKIARSLSAQAGGAS